jgi:hypothetical protein
MKLFRRTQVETDYCERCDAICGPVCQAAAERERQFLSLIRSGMRIA